MEEYLALDAASEDKYEFLSGIAVAMSGAAPRHTLIAANISGTLRQLLAKSGGVTSCGTATGLMCSQQCGTAAAVRNGTATRLMSTRRRSEPRPG